jgi:hypothetical protein
MRKVIKRGYYQRRVWEPGEEVDVPSGFQASWLEGPKRQKRTKRVETPSEPEVTPETDESNDDAG